MFVLNINVENLCTLINHLSDSLRFESSRNQVKGPCAQQTLLTLSSAQHTLHDHKG